MTPYWVWLLGVSGLFVVLERLTAARREQKVLRPQIWNDLFYLGFNGHFYAVLTAGIVIVVETTTLSIIPEPLRSDLRILQGRQFLVQFFAYFVIADFLQWLVHNLLHRVPILWQFHKIHHSAHEMDWAVNFRFHWMELVVYKSLLYLPLLVLGGDGEPLMAVFVFGTAWGHFNHANTKIKIGVLGYIFNSPSMHLWHHDSTGEGGTSKNFGIVLSCWDFLFRTAFWPRGRDPKRLGFPRDDSVPDHILGQELHPLMSRSTLDQD
ncbi:MAG: sterol desaturase/sphingolipid hydroxylase (fatty acid hydroxylase superfamily) [Planctomycetota bacterium]|jgi:sterol desaturase/sphingolipid hydroxylase (fatty acid hydroxylase superfamily)